MKRTQQTLLIGILVVIALVMVWIWFARPDVSVTLLSPHDPAQFAVIDVLDDETTPIPSENATANLSNSDTTDAITTDLDKVDLGDLDAEFEAIDAELETL